LTNTHELGRCLTEEVIADRFCMMLKSNEPST